MEKVKKWETLIKNNLGCGMMLTFIPDRDGYAVLRELFMYANAGHIKFVDNLLPKALLLSPNWSNARWNVEVVFNVCDFWSEFRFQRLVQGGLSDVKVAPEKNKK